MVFIGIFVIFACTIISHAQILTGNIKGTVTDEEGTTLPGVSVELSSEALIGGPQFRITSKKGGFNFLDLPPGSYTIVAKLNGFQKIIIEDIRVRVGVTVTQDIVMKPSPIQETIIVMGKTTMIDISSSGTDTHFDEDYLETIASGRYTFIDIVKQAPGIIHGESSWAQDLDFSSLGSNIESNAIRLDGLDIGDPVQGTAIVLPNQEIYKEVHVSAMGSSAEYGNFTGAVVNIVTKSGGNEFSGSIGYFGQFNSLTDDNNPDPEKYFSFNRNKYNDAVFTLGGPIIKDRLWFFTSVNIVRNDATSWQENPEYQAPINDDNYFLKLTSKLGKSHKLSGIFSFRNHHIEYPPTPYTKPESTYITDDFTPNWNLIYTWLISSNAYLELKISGYRNDLERVPPPEGSIHNPVHYDLLTGVTSNGAWWPRLEYKERFQGKVKLSYFAEEFLGGDHEFKVGAQYTRTEKGTACLYGGGYVMFTYGGEPYLRYQQHPFYYGSLVNHTGVFIDDSWTLWNDRLTLNLGLRYDNHTGAVPELPVMDVWNKTDKTNPPVKGLVEWNTISPRLGFVLQLTKDKQTVLKAHYGRYQYPMISGAFDFPGPNATPWIASYWTGTEWEVYNYVPAEKVRNDPQNLRPTVMDMYTIGLEREIIADFSIGLRAVYKKHYDHAAIKNVAGEYELVPMISPDNGETYMVYNQLNVGDNEYVITNQEDFDQTYKGIIFTLKKRYSNNWMMNASLTRSRSEGLICVSPRQTGQYSQQGIIAISSWTYGRDPNDWINADGLLQMDRKWVFKFQLGYNFPWGILASVNYNYLGGRPWTPRVRVYPDQGRRIIMAEPRSDKNRFDPINLLHLRLQKNFHLYNRLKFSLTADIFNVFNVNTTTEYQTHYMWSLAYLEPSAIPAPRRLQIGLKLEF